MSTTLIDIEDIGWRDGGGFVDLDNRDIALAFKLYPWEWMFRDAFGARLAEAPTRWIEPPWKAVLSNKGILPLLWEMFPGHPNLLPAFFEDDPRAQRARHILCAQAAVFARGRQCRADQPGRAAGASRTGLMAAKDSSARRSRRCAISTGNIRCIGSWLVDHTPCGLSIREDESPITGNNSRFLPHAII